MPYFYQDEKQKKNKILKTRLKISAECKRDWKRTLPNTKSVALLFSAFFYALNKAAWTFTLELSILKSWFFPFSLHLIAHNVGYYLISLFFFGSFYNFFCTSFIHSGRRKCSIRDGLRGAVYTKKIVLNDMKGILRRFLFSEDIQKNVCILTTREKKAWKLVHICCVYWGILLGEILILRISLNLPDWVTW